ncbi:DUF6241 domain-containing protein [Metabacillus sp. 84]|uniref:DUF6241 domain-containing protein n=1 Tax=Metabacillus sp. 84 TaxID=3404705 RepID=UPI003CE9A3E6
MKKSQVIWVGSIAIAGSVALIIYYMIGQDGSRETLKVKESKTPNNEIIEIEEANAVPSDKEFPINMNESDMQNAIHGMSHQKVEAEDKWGFIPLTSERIKRLIAVLQHNQENYEHYRTYKEILDRWNDNDFSKVDHDHNRIWELQNGNVGKATGILSAEEEKEFIEEHYNIERK